MDFASELAGWAERFLRSPTAGVVGIAYWASYPTNDDLPTTLLFNRHPYFYDFREMVMLKVMRCGLMVGLASVTMMASAETAQTVVPTYTEAKPAIMVSAQQPRFVIRLKSNPTTGYAWFLRECNSELIQPIKHEFEASADKKLMGASGYEIWTFQMKPAGFVVPYQTVMRFVYARPFEAADNSTPLLFKVTTSTAK